MTDIQKWADDAMFPAQPIKSGEDGGPRVELISMTPDPLGEIASMARMYEGKPTYGLEDITDEERVRYFESIQKTKLQAPFEAVHFHFFIEGISRSTTHQLVRQRTAVYAQESLRFAVKEEVECVEPPTIKRLSNSPQDQSNREVWDDALKHAFTAYHYLVGNGIPAEDARELLPHATATRIHYITNLRNLVEHAGNRLCTQAVPVWRQIFTGIVSAIRNYMPPNQKSWEGNWQFPVIANSMLFRPACYQQGKCPFSSDIDRGCTIRGRVDQFAAHGVPSYAWGGDEDEVVSLPNGDWLPAIRPEEWLLNIDAGRTHK